jgi:hypothetical protein
MRNTPFLSAIYVIDELPLLDRLPWRESMQSVLQFADEVIVVHGGKTQGGGRRETVEYLERLRDPRIRIYVFPWPEDFDWRQIARTCAFGHLKASGEWCFRVLADEVFPEDFQEMPRMLRSLPPEKDTVSVERLYMLGCQYACAFHDKPLFFRNNRSLGYGTINPEQGPAASQLLFDDPLDCDHVFENGRPRKVERSILRDPEGERRLCGGEVPCGYRDVTEKGLVRIPKGLLNVDVNFVPDDLLLMQKEISQEGYLRLPPDYPHRPRMTREQMATALQQKIRDMLDHGMLRRVCPPAPLLDFMDRQESVHNIVRNLCEDVHGLPWNRVSKRGGVLRQGVTLLTNRWHRARRAVRLMP